MFQTMNSVRWKNLSLKYQRFTPSGGKNIGISKSEFVTKTQFLFLGLLNIWVCRARVRFSNNVWLYCFVSQRANKALIYLHWDQFIQDTKVSNLLIKVLLTSLIVHIKLTSWASLLSHPLERGRLYLDLSLSLLLKTLDSSS